MKGFKAGKTADNTTTPITTTTTTTTTTPITPITTTTSKNVDDVGVVAVVGVITPEVGGSFDLISTIKSLDLGDGADIETVEEIGKQYEM